MPSIEIRGANSGWGLKFLEFGPIMGLLLGIFLIVPPYI